MATATPQAMVKAVLSSFKCAAHEQMPSTLMKRSDVGDAFDGLDPTEVDKRLLDLQMRVQSTERVHSQSNALRRDALRAMLTHRVKQTMRMVDTIALGTQVKRAGIQAYLARNFAVAKQAFGLGEAYTAEGWTRNNLITARRVYEGQMSDLLAQMEVAERIKVLQDGLEPLRKELGLSRSEWGVIGAWAVEDGYHPFIQLYQDLNPVGMQRLNQRHLQLIDYMKSKGLTDTHIEQMLSSARNIAEIYEEVAQAAEQLGMTVDRTELIGYFTRVASEDAMKRFNWKWMDEHGNIEWNDGARESVEQTFQRARGTNEFAVEDEVVLDFMFREIIRQDLNGNKTLAKLLEDSGGVAGLISDERLMSEALVRALTPTQLDALISSGIISKLPMNTIQVFDYLRRTSPIFEFPFKQLEEVFATDWNVGYRVYQDSLVNAVGQSGMFQMVVANALNSKWAIAPYDIDELVRDGVAKAEDFREFVPFSEVFPDRIREAFGLPTVGGAELNRAPRMFESLGLTPDEAARLDNLNQLRVHPLVVDFLKAEMDILTNPQGMGVFAHAVAQYNTAFRFMSTSSGDFVMRQMWNSLRATQAAKGNLFMWLDKMQKQTRMLLMHSVGKDPLSVLDNTHKIYNNNGVKLTERELYVELRRRGIMGQMEAVFTGEQPGRYRNFRMDEMLSYVKNQLRYLLSTMQAYGPMNIRMYTRTADQIAELLKTFATTIGHPFRVGNTLADDIGRFTTFSTLLSDTSMPNLAGQMITGQARLRFNNIDEAFEHIQNYFYMYDDVGVTNKQMARYVIPFWTFTSKNLPAMVRHAIRNPHRYLAYVKTLAFIQTAMSGDDPYLISNAVPDWLKGEEPVMFNAGDTDGDGEDNYFIMPTTALDPMASVRDVADTATWMLNRLGIWDTEGKNKTPNWEQSRTNELGKGVLENLYPLWSSVVAWAFSSTGNNIDMRELRLSREPDSAEMFGFYTSGVNKYIWESNLPILRTIQRLNPFMINGAPYRYDERTGELEMKGVPGLGGAVPRSSASRANDPRIQLTVGDAVRSLTNNNANVPLLDAIPTAWVGLNFRPLEVARNIGASFDDMRSTIRDGIREIKNSRRRLQDITDPNLQYREFQRIIEMENVAKSMMIDYANLQAWMEYNRIPPQQWVQQMRRRDMTVGDLPQIATQEEYDLLYRMVYEGVPPEEAYQRLFDYQQNNDTTQGSRSAQPPVRP